MFPSLLLLPFDNLKHVPHGKGDFGQIAQNFDKLAVGRFSYPLYLRKGKKGSRVAKLIDSPFMPDAEAAFMVTEHGIEDL